MMTSIASAAAGHEPKLRSRPFAFGMIFEQNQKKPSVAQVSRLTGGGGGVTVNLRGRFDSPLWCNTACQ